jgi:hypothetical protein
MKFHESLFSSSLAVSCIPIDIRNNFNTRPTEIADVPEMFLEWLISKKQATDDW